MNKILKQFVVLGGTSGEREVSSKCVCFRALKKKYHKLKFDPKFKNFNLIDKRKIDVFLSLYGKEGEDGVAQPISNT